ncbi:hypothetical protein CMZ84_04935 [Lysobacteraceae bacterium NML93-0399]|nr:hypothetical protein CMZ84_04935 [Xanthomonadaceae bacterium NML93-0399]
MTVSRPVLLLVCLALAAPAASRADTLTRADCAAPLSTSDADLCMASEYARLDASLDAVHADTVALLASDASCVGDCAGAQAAVADAQTAWQQVRSRDCDAAFAIAIQGSGRNAARLQCLIDHTRTRIGQLQRFLSL